MSMSLGFYRTSSGFIRDSHVVKSSLCFGNLCRITLPPSLPFFLLFTHQILIEFILHTSTEPESMGYIYVATGVLTKYREMGYFSSQRPSFCATTENPDSLPCPNPFHVQLAKISIFPWGKQKWVQIIHQVAQQKPIFSMKLCLFLP